VRGERGAEEKRRGLEEGSIKKERETRQDKERKLVT